LSIITHKNSHINIPNIVFMVSTAKVEAINNRAIGAIAKIIAVNTILR
jgi:hypothetical protein